MKVIFFNHFHNGDIHLSRSLVRLVIEKVKTIDNNANFAYSHRNDSSLLNDILDLKFDPHTIDKIHEHTATFKSGDTIYFNTWYAQEHFKYMNKHGITLDTLYLIFDNACQNIWGFSLKDISDNPSVFYPSIDYSKFEIQNVKTWLQNNTGRKVFIANGHAKSGQAHNFNMTDIINKVAEKHTSTTFILTNIETPITLPNVMYSSDIIKKQGFDLNENGYLSEHCDLIIGRSSGAFSFAMTQNNMFNRSIKFLDFSSLIPKIPGQYWLDTLLQDKIIFSSHIVNTNTSNVEAVLNIIESYL